MKFLLVVTPQSIYHKVILVEQEEINAPRIADHSMSIRVYRINNNIAEWIKKSISENKNK